MTSEHACYLPSGCYAVVHVPEQVRGAAVVVPPFAEEKKAAQRALVEAARALAEAGWDTLRFDFRGTGDSRGEHGEVDLGTWLADLREVLAIQRHRYPHQPLALLGLRLGATLAWLAAGEPPGVDQLVLWEPLPSGAAYLRQNRQRSQIRRELTAGEGPQAVAGGDGAFAPLDFDGFLLSARLQEQLAGVDLLQAPPPGCRRVQILQVSGSARLKKPFEDLRSRAVEAGLDTALEHAAVEAFWSAIGLVDTAPVRDATLGWLAPGPQAVAAAPAPAAAPTPTPVAPRVTAEPVLLPSGDQQIRGVLYLPAEPGQRLVLLLHGWSGYRIGPGHLLTEAARALAAAGCAACSFDFRGRGESDWEVTSASLNSMIRDAQRAIPLLAERTGATTVTLLGLCSGSEVALGASLSDPRVDTLALWSAPIFSGTFDLARRARRSRAMLGGYLRKLVRRETWAKLLGGRLNWRLIARALSGGRSAEDAGVADKAPDTATQMQAFEAYRGRLLFIYGGNDPETPPSREFYREFVQRTGMDAAFHEVEGANHNYYSLGWKEEVIGVTLNWLGLAAAGGGPADEEPR